MMQRSASVDAPDFRHTLNRRDWHARREILHAR